MMLRMMAVVVLLLLGTRVEAQVASAQERWVLIGKKEGEGSHRLYVDMATTDLAFDAEVVHVERATVWTKTVYSEMQKGEPDSRYDFNMVYYRTELQCRLRRARFLTIISYRMHGNHVQVAHMVTEPTDWFDIVPESNVELEHRLLCQRGEQ